MKLGKSYLVKLKNELNPKILYKINNLIFNKEKRYDMKELDKTQSNDNNLTDGDPNVIEISSEAFDKLEGILADPHKDITPAMEELFSSGSFTGEEELLYKLTLQAKQEMLDGKGSTPEEVLLRLRNKRK